MMTCSNSWYAAPTSGAERSPSFAGDCRAGRARQRLESDCEEARLRGPALEVRLREIEAAVRLDQHIDGHQEAHGVTAPFVIEDELDDGKFTARGQGIVGLA